MNLKADKAAALVQAVREAKQHLAALSENTKPEAYEAALDALREAEDSYSEYLFRTKETT